jgi:hypothetical protein
MKKVLLLIFVPVLCQYNLSVSLGAAGTKSEQLPLRVEVDSRVELMSVIFRLAGNPEYNKAKLDSYTNDVEKQFGKFRAHPAVKLAQKLRQAQGISYDACMNMAVHITDTQKCQERIPFEPRPESLEFRWTPDSARQFLTAARQFVKDSNFNDFFSAHRSLYQTAQLRLEDFLKKNAHIEWFDEYFGARPEANFTIFLGLLNGPNNYGATFHTPDGKEELYCILGIWKTDDKGLPVFDDSMMETIVHEFCHSYVGPFIAKYKMEIDKCSKLFEPVADRMIAQAYGSWQTCVNEHIVRALTTRYAYLKVSKEAGDNYLKYQRQNGFFYVPALCESLKNYEKNRDKYRAFADFYPELIKVFENLSQQDLGKDFYFIPYEGTINAVGQDKKSVILIVPTNENDPGIQKSINDFVRQYQKRFYPQSPILTDANAIKRDLSQNSLIIFGTTNGNLWLKENASKFPFKIDANNITADKVYEGTDLRFISAWLNPQNPQRGILIYTAQQARDIIYINTVFHGPTDYVIARGSNVINAGNYNKGKNQWSF